MKHVEVAQGSFDLERYPSRSAEPLRSWDAADELLLNHLGDFDQQIDMTGNVLLVNDGYGALATALAVHEPWSMMDSFCAMRGTEENLRRNGINASVISLSPLDPLPARIDVLLMKIPKSLSTLEDQLHRIAPHLHAGTVVIAAAMTKHIHASTLGVFERLVGPTRTSLAVKKARLIFCEPDPSIECGPNPWPITYALPDGQVITSHAGVFSPDRLDAGTRLLLDNLPGSDEPMDVVDLGCGNGIIGMILALRNRRADVTFVDDSYLAVASAEQTFSDNLGVDRSARFVVGNSLLDLTGDEVTEPGTIDLVLCNPPFHSNHALTDATAWLMFSDCHVALRSGGELWVVGNRHLAYHAKLKRLFGNCEVIASDSKFVVLRTVRT